MFTIEFILLLASCVLASSSRHVQNEPKQNLVMLQGYGSGGRNYASGNDASYGSHNSYGPYDSLYPFTTSLACMVGDFENAVPIACEYGQSYCQINLNKINNDGFGYSYACSSVCVPNDVTICSTGILSNKWAPICLIGDLSATSEGAVPGMCMTGQACALDANLQGSCMNSCDPTSSLCSLTDYGNKQGPFCWVGIFGTDATFKGCGKSQSCQTTTTVATVVGACAQTCTASSTVTCSTDKDNRQGLICFVGQFGDLAEPVACNKGQICQRETILTESSSTITNGACVSKCVPSPTTYCCSTNLCNGYQAESHRNFFNYASSNY